MDKSIRVFVSLDEMKAAEYRAWRGRPAYERMNAVKELTLAAYGLREDGPDVPRLERTLVHLPRPRR